MLVVVVVVAAFNKGDDVCLSTVGGEGFGNVRYVLIIVMCIPSSFYYLICRRSRVGSLKKRSLGLKRRLFD